MSEILSREEFDGIAYPERRDLRATIEALAEALRDSERFAADKNVRINYGLLVALREKGWI